MGQVSRFGFLAAIMMTLAACAANHTLRPDPRPCRMGEGGEQCADRAMLIQTSPSGEEFQLGFVEVDDQGQVRDRRQLDTVLGNFERVAGTEDVLLVGFVHGWHHNARHDDDNVARFSELLGKLAKAEAQGSRRKVLGLYVGWRGESVTVPGFRYLTFWERKGTAQKVGSHGVTEVFLKLEQIVNVKAGQDGDGPQQTRSRLVLLGHSFGGAVVFNALGQILEDRFIDSRSGKTAMDTAKGFGDLVVLVNPAFEALRYASLYDVSRDRCSYFPSQLPRLVILTSEADWATGLAFPAGRSLSTFFETHNTVDRNYCPDTRWAEPLRLHEGQADRNTVGHFEPFLTHELRALKAAGPSSEVSHLGSLSGHWQGNLASDRVELGGVELVRRGKAHPRNPYLNIRVDRALIPDHNEIWDDRIIGFVRDLIMFSTLPEQSPPQGASHP